MLKGNKLKFQRGAAAKTEGEDRNNGGENRPQIVTVRPAREITNFSQLCGDLSKDRARNLKSSPSQETVPAKYFVSAERNFTEICVFA